MRVFRFTQIFLQEETIDITTEIVVEKELKQDDSPCNKRINVCSDVIESIFGKYKRMISNNKFAGVSYIALGITFVHNLFKSTTKRNNTCH